MALAPSTPMIASIANLFSTGTPHLALYTSNPTAGDTGTELTGGSYSRKPITFGSVSGAAISNTSAITFTGLPGATITHYGIKSAATGGQLRGFGPLNNTVVSVSGDELTFNIGSVQVTIAGS